ncbi:LysR family transcriptional regulator [Clostridium manihotivorum]|uniref:LysR family transcriptional regulator n=1 Tax=Clostridium manihotivorum TaxID=2320868 RepID=A0A3R5QVJ5_9CLOT|nr:LysR family transcriptional regulator [Clostridium manihotivorum]QAA33605.1 LysR family transcriptional regulator [Clostridium manihotivorum]
MTLKHLRIFVTVCNCNSVTAAAEKLYLAQPSVSLAIRELEEHYCVKLFDRISKKMYLTEPGKQLLNYANHIVSLFDEMECEIKDWDSAGILRIGSSITIGNYLLPEYIQIFKEKYPNIKMQVIIDNSEKIEQNIMANHIDFGLIEGVVHNPHINSHTFMEDELVLICGVNHPLSSFNEVEIEMLKEYEFILREKGSGGRELFDSTMLLHGMEVKPIWESVSNQAIIKAVSAGLGLSVLPYLLVKKDLESGIVKQIKIKALSLNRKFHIIYHKNKFLTTSAKEFIALCKTHTVPFDIIGT